MAFTFPYKASLNYLVRMPLTCRGGGRFCPFDVTCPELSESIKHFDLAKNGLGSKPDISVTFLMATVTAFSN